MNIIPKLCSLALSATCLLPISVNAFNPLHIPRHGDVVTVHRTTPLLPIDSAMVWDFSNAEVIEPNIEWRYFVWGDTLISETRPHIRRDYRVAGDSISLVCTETSTLRLDAIGDGVPCTLPSDQSPFITPLTERGRQYQSDSIWGEGSSKLESIKVGTLILPDECEINNTIMHSRTLTSYRSMGPASMPRTARENHPGWYHTETVISWYAPQGRYLVAETRIATDSVAGYEPLVAYQSYISPLETQPFEPSHRDMIVQSAAPGYNKEYPNPSIKSNIPDGWIPGKGLESQTYIIEDNQIAISGVAPAEGEVSFLLCDILGRVYARSSSITAAAGAQISTVVTRPSNLPAGNYLLQTITPAGVFVEKIILH